MQKRVIFHCTIFFMIWANITEINDIIKKKLQSTVFPGDIFHFSMTVSTFQKHCFSSNVIYQFSTFYFSVMLLYWNFKVSLMKNTMSNMSNAMNAIGFKAKWTTLLFLIRMTDCQLHNISLPLLNMLNRVTMSLLDSVRMLDLYQQVSPSLLLVTDFAFDHISIPLRPEI